MSTIFMGLEIGKRSIMAQQTALEVTGHNIANANTTGYTRQVASLQATRPYATPSLNNSTHVGQMGTGVDAAEIARIRDAFLDEQIRNESRDSGYWELMQESLSRIEAIFVEPSDTGLRTAMDQFWESWQDLSVNPESEAVRAVVAERGMALADAFNHNYTQLKELQEDLNSSVTIKVSEINSIAQQISDLNEQILAIKVSGQQPNDLLDQRDVLLDQLSGIVDINTHTDEYGMVTVQLGGRNLVQGEKYTPLSTATDADGMSMVIWKDTGIKAVITSGELGALLDLRGATDLPQDSGSQYKEIIPDLIEELNTMAKTTVMSINEIHRSGYSLNNKLDPASGYPDGINFFNLPDDPENYMDWAKSMQVSQVIVDDVNNIAAAGHRTWDENNTESNFGDGSVALEIAQLKNSFNSAVSTTRSDSLSGVMEDFPNSVSGDLTISFNGGSTAIISLAAPSSPYQDLQELAAAIQDQINANSTLSAAGISITVRCDGDQLAFSSSSPKFEAVSNSGLLGGGISFTALSTTSGVVTDVTCDDYWRGVTAEIGVESQAASNMVENQETLISQLESKRQSISGVSLDEEMTNMIKFQHAYNAASRFITTIDEQLDTIINRMGTVGR